VTGATFDITDAEASDILATFGAEGLREVRS
jgi:hypothetical protein